MSLAIKFTNFLTCFSLKPEKLTFGNWKCPRNCASGNLYFWRFLGTTYPYRIKKFSSLRINASILTVLSLKHQFALMFTANPQPYNTSLHWGIIALWVVRNPNICRFLTDSPLIIKRDGSHFYRFTSIFPPTSITSRNTSSHLLWIQLYETARPEAWKGFLVWLTFEH